MASSTVFAKCGVNRFPTSLTVTLVAKPAHAAQPHPILVVFQRDRAGAGEFIVAAIAMASVKPPDTAYHLHLPIDVVREGRISDLQIEDVIYADHRRRGRQRRERGHIRLPGAMRAYNPRRLVAHDRLRVVEGEFADPDSTAQVRPDHANSGDRIRTPPEPLIPAPSGRAARWTDRRTLPSDYSCDRALSRAAAKAEICRP